MKTFLDCNNILVEDNEIFLYAKDSDACATLGRSILDKVFRKTIDPSKHELNMTIVQSMIKRCQSCQFEEETVHSYSVKLVESYLRNFNYIEKDLTEPLYVIGIDKYELFEGARDLEIIFVMESMSRKQLINIIDVIRNLNLHEPTIVVQSEDIFMNKLLVSSYLDNHNVNANLSYFKEDLTVESILSQSGASDYQD